jgi:CBS domain-containing protein
MEGGEGTIPAVEEFLALFNRLEDELQQIAGGRPGQRFFELVDRAAQRNPIVRRASPTLRDCGDLRNLLVHSRDFPREVPAVPTAETVQALRRIVEALTRPRRLEQVASRIGRVFRPEEPLTEALRYMRQQGYAQVAVVGPEGTALLTVRGVARWLEDRVDGGVVDAAGAAVADALAFEGRGTHLAMARHATVDDARLAFVEAIERGERLLAVVVTEHGRLAERPIGIVTPWDLLDGAGQ